MNQIKTSARITLTIALGVRQSMETRGEARERPRPSRTVVSEVGVEESGLLAQIAGGDQGAALAAICDRYASRIYGLGMRLLGDRGMAEELVQDTFVRVWRSAPRFDPERGSARTFIYTLARRAAVDLQRRTASRPLPTVADEENDGPKATVDRAALDAYEETVLGIDVRDALNTLSEKHRDTLLLCYDEDLSRREIAERLGIPMGTVKTRIHYALRALKLELEERGLV
jgi:RNA polymerase sigma-70 factor (ECF subfamily)